MNVLGNTAAAGLAGFTRDLRKTFGSSFDTEILASNRSPGGALRSVGSCLIDGYLIRASGVRSARPALDTAPRHSPQLLVTLTGRVEVAHNGRTAAMNSGDMVLTGSLHRVFTMSRMRARRW